MRYIQLWETAKCHYNSRQAIWNCITWKWSKKFNMQKLLAIKQLSMNRLHHKYMTCY